MSDADSAHPAAKHRTARVPEEFATVCAARSTTSASTPAPFCHGGWFEPGNTRSLRCGSPKVEGAGRHEGARLRSPSLRAHAWTAYGSRDTGNWIPLLARRRAFGLIGVKRSGDPAGRTQYQRDTWRSQWRERRAVAHFFFLMIRSTSDAFAGCTSKPVLLPSRPPRT